MITNNRDVVGLELDFYFPNLKLAIELNGILHYEPIYGHDRLTKIQCNDKQKFIQCYNKGIELIVVDTTHIKKFKQHKAEEIFQLIYPIIKSAYDFIHKQI